MERKLLEAIKNITDLNMTEDEALKLLENNNTNLMTEFGLDSLLRVQFIIELEEVFDIEVDIESGFCYGWLDRLGRQWSGCFAHWRGEYHCKLSGIFRLCHSQPGGPFRI